MVTVNEVLEKLKGEYFRYEIYNNSAFTIEMEKQNGRYADEVMNRNVAYFELMHESRYYSKHKECEPTPFADIVGADKYHGEKVLMIAVYLTDEEMCGNLFDALENNGTVTGMDTDVLERIKSMTTYAKRIEAEMPKFEITDIGEIKADGNMWELSVAIETNNTVNVATMCNGTEPILENMADLFRMADMVVFNTNERNKIGIKFCVDGLFTTKEGE